MATGYTYPVKDGKVTEFADFVWNCARAFGALISMRDEASDAKIPDEFEPSAYYVDSVKRCREALADAQRLTEQDAENRQTAEIEKAHEYRNQYQETRRVERERYETMLAKVTAWTPPTPDHVGLRSFMIEQLTTSIEFDCEGTYMPNVPERMPNNLWLAKRILGALNSLADAEKSLAEEADRIGKRNAWLRQLRESVLPNRS